jgi:6-phosphogluconate dehydrogenase (decarboxylating)
MTVKDLKKVLSQMDDSAVVVMATCGGIVENMQSTFWHDVQNNQFVINDGQSVYPEETNGAWDYLDMGQYQFKR